MKKAWKILLRILKLLVIALGLTAILFGVMWYIAEAPLREIERKDKADPVYQQVMAEVAEKEKAEKETQKKLDKKDKEKQEKEKAIADFEKTVRGKYTKESLSAIISSDLNMAARLVEIGGYDSMVYWFTSHNWDDDLCYDELSYYVFKNQKSAEKAFKIMKESWIETETDSGNNYVQGWEAGVLDAEVEVFIYQIDNMIIVADLQVVSGWAEPEYEQDSDSISSFYYRKDFIIDNFRK